MAKEINTRDALLQLRRVVVEDAERSAKLKALDEERDALQAEKTAALQAALDSLEGYVELQSRLHGFSGALENLVVETGGKTQSVRKKKEKKKEKVEVVATTGRSAPTRRLRATGYPLTLDETIVLSPKEQDFIDILAARWPLFTTPQHLVRKGVIPKPNHVTAKVNQLRKKGVPIESARQAKQDGAENLGNKPRGYRLIG